MMEFFFLLKENYLISIVFILVISFALFVVYSIWRSRDKFEKGFVRTSMAILILFIFITLYFMLFILYIFFISLLIFIYIIVKFFLEFIFILITLYYKFF